MENADESVSTCVCVHVPFTTMCMCVHACASLKGVSEASMSAAKRQNTLGGFPFTSTCMRVCLLRVLVRHHCQRLEDKTHLNVRLRVCVCPCFARS